MLNRAISGANRNEMEVASVISFLNPAGSSWKTEMSINEPTEIINNMPR